MAKSSCWPYINFSIIRLMMDDDDSRDEMLEDDGGRIALRGEEDEYLRSG